MELLANLVLLGSPSARGKEHLRRPAGSVRTADHPEGAIQWPSERECIQVRCRFENRPFLPTI